MCGIAAILGTVPGGLLEPIRAMGACVRHRGPDDEGYALLAAGREPVLLGGPDTPSSSYAAGLPYSPRPDAEAEIAADATVALGHRRLSIVDVSPAGHCPLSYRGRYWITYNGEVYNYLELRAELEGLGHRFLSHTDTEVVLAAYDQWGPAALSRMNGMWAFAIADRERRTLFVARDRWGIKPLYCWAAPGGFVAFASEIKQFTVLPGWSARMNGQRAYDFLNWRITDHTAETLFAGVHQLRGGESVELPWPAPGAPASSAAGAPPAATRWYHLRPAPFSGSFDDAAARFRELLTDSVRLRLRADVPVGSCLSGGLDSSSIVCAMDRLLRDGGGQAVQKTFSAYSDDPRFDEREYVEEVVRHTAVEPHHVTPRMDGAFDSLPCVAWHQDEPFSSTSIYAQWNVFRIARENGVIVMLDGQGADEQLAGYPAFFAPRMAELARAGRLPTLWSEVGALKRLHGHSPASSAAQLLNLLLPAPAARLGRRFAARTHEAPGWLDLDLLGAEPVDPFAEKGARARSVEALSVAQLTATNLQMLLHWEDRDSMAHSVESRIPFLDYRLVEFVLGLPTAHKVSGGVTKRVLREGMRGVLPERVRGRMDKMGFVTAEEAWTKEGSPERFRRAAREAVEASAGVVRPAALEKVERIIRGDEPFEPFAWRLISFGAWARRFAVAP
ncbi:MAG: asparagine synthase (glutamine-hydrolyzing) [Longimicrobiaceae bacterium]